MPPKPKNWLCLLQWLQLQLQWPLSSFWRNFRTVFAEFFKIQPHWRVDEHEWPVLGLSEASFKSRSWLGNSKTLSLFYWATQRWTCWCVSDLCPALEVTNCWLDILFQVESRIHMVPSIIASCPGPEDTKQSQTIMFDCWYICFMKCWVTFTPDITGCAPSKTSDFCCQSTKYLPQRLGDHQDVLGKCETSLWVLFGQQRFLLWALSWMPFVPSCSYCWIMNTDHWPRHVWPAVLDMMFWVLLWPPGGVVDTLGAFLVGPSCSSFSPAVDNRSHRGLLGSQSCRNGFVSLFRPIRQCFPSFLEVL